MQTERRIFRNTLALGAGKALGDLATFAFLMYFSREFGREALGQYAFAMSAGGLLSLLTSFGLNTYTVREVSRNRACGPAFIGPLLVLRLGLAALSLLPLWAVAWFSPVSPATRPIVMLIGAYHLLLMVSGILEAGFMAHEEMRFPSLMEILRKLSILGGGSLLIAAQAPPAATLGIFPASALAALAIEFIAFRRLFGAPEFHLRAEFLKTALRESWPFFMIVILSQFYDRFGVLALTYLQGESVTGIYMAADRLLATLNGFPVIFTTALFPAQSNLFAARKEEFLQICQWSLRLMVVSLFPLGVLLFVFREPILRLAFGAEFLPSARVLEVGAWSLAIIGINRVLAMVLVVSDRQTELVRLRAMAYGLYALGVVALAHRMSYMGVIWAKLLTEGALLAVTLVQVSRIAGLGATLRAFLAPVGLSVVGLSLCAGVHWDGRVTAGLTLILFFTCGALCGGIRRTDLRFLGEVLGRRSLRPPRAPAP